MAKKNVSVEDRRKQLKYGRAGAAAPVAAAPVGGTSDGATSRPAVATALVTSDGRNFRYVAHDLVMILAIGGSLLILELVLAFLFDHTGLGAAVYRIVNV